MVAVQETPTTYHVVDVFLENPYSNKPRTHVFIHTNKTSISDLTRGLLCVGIYRLPFEDQINENFRRLTEPLRPYKRPSTNHYVYDGKVQAMLIQRLCAWRYDPSNETIDASQLNLIERIEDPNVTTLNPHEIARALRALYETSNPEGVRQLRDAYLISLRELRPFASAEERRQTVDENLLFAAILADEAARCGYEASGQRIYAARAFIASISFVTKGPVTKFCKEAIDYKPNN